MEDPSTGVSEPLAIRDLRESDWPALLALANQSVAGVRGAGSQEEWVRNRRSFDASTGIQQQLVAEISGAPVGYGALESRDPAEPHSFRLFVVTARESFDVVGQRLYDELGAHLRALGATEVWFREYASDSRFVAFARRNGFSEDAREVVGGVELVVLRKTLGSGRSAREVFWRVALGFAVVAIVAAFIGIPIARMFEAHERSAQQALFAQLCGELGSFYVETGRAPETIDDLRARLTFPDGSSPDRLELYELRAAPESRAIVWQSPDGPRQCDVSMRVP